MTPYYQTTPYVNRQMADTNGSGSHSDDNERNDRSADRQSRTEEIRMALENAREYRDRTVTSKRPAERTTERLPERLPVREFHRDDDDTRSVATAQMSSAMSSAMTVNGTYLGPDGRPMQVVAIPAGTAIKTVDTDAASESEFQKLDYETIQINLRLLSDIVQDEKLHISSDGKTMVVDNRYAQHLRRYWSGDSRSRTLYFIKHVYAEAERLCNEIVDLVNAGASPKENTEKLINLYGLIQASTKGLDRLNMTYSDDKLIAAKIATIKKDFETYCDQTLKKTIDGFNQMVDLN